MGRILSPAHTLALSAVVTAPGHLLALGLPSPLLLSDLGNATDELGQAYTAADLKFEGISFNGNGPPEAVRVRIGNHDGSAGAAVLNQNLSDVPAVIRVYEANTPPAQLSPIVVDFVINGCTIGLDYVHLTLMPAVRFAPFRRIDPSHGFKYATPAGTKVTWGNEVITIESEK